MDENGEKFLHTHLRPFTIDLKESGIKMF